MTEQYTCRSKRKRSLHGAIKSAHFKNSISLQALCSKVASRTDYLYAEVLEIAEEVFTEIVLTMLNEGKEVRIDKFGNFCFKARKPCRKYSPRSGKEYFTKASVGIVWKPSRVLNEYMQKNGRALWYKIEENQQKVKELKEQATAIKKEELKEKPWYKPLVKKNGEICE